MKKMLRAEITNKSDSPVTTHPLLTHHSTRTTRSTDRLHNVFSTLPSFLPLLLLSLSLSLSLSLFLSLFPSFLHTHSLNTLYIAILISIGARCSFPSLSLSAPAFPPDRSIPPWILLRAQFPRPRRVIPVCVTGDCTLDRASLVGRTHTTPPPHHSSPIEISPSRPTAFPTLHWPGRHRGSWDSRHHGFLNRATRRSRIRPMRRKHRRPHVADVPPASRRLPERRTGVPLSSSSSFSVPSGCIGKTQIAERAEYGGRHHRSFRLNITLVPKVPAPRIPIGHRGRCISYPDRRARPRPPVRLARVPPRGSGSGTRRGNRRAQGPTGERPPDAPGTWNGGPNRWHRHRGRPGRGRRRWPNSVRSSRWVVPAGGGADPGH